MINLIADRIGPYVGVEPQAFSASDVTGSYYLMGKKNTYTLMVNDLEAGEIAKLDILQATDVDGTGAKAITDQDDTATATGTITGRARAQKLSVLVDSVTNGKTIILVCSQGGSAVTYTKAAATDATAQEFLNAAGLVLCINTDQSEYVTASASGTTVTIILAHPEKGG
ncbi:MAG: hypothetical protein KAH01_07580, partial [Caldisericia bacterium]|nr:hypothetical protein [Caldisericia bacterium]